jgi:hypothetical protein
MATKRKQSAAGKPNNRPSARSLALSIQNERSQARADQAHDNTRLNAVSHNARAVVTHNTGRHPQYDSTIGHPQHDGASQRPRHNGAGRHSRSSSPTHHLRPTSASNKARRAANINKSAFVRSLPASLSAAAVIDRGKAKGIRLSAAQVYTIRANARRKGDDGAKVSTRGRPPGRRAGVEAGGGGGRATEAKEAEFIATALDLGLARAEALIDALRRRAAKGWS